MTFDLTLLLRFSHWSTASLQYHATETMSWYKYCTSNTDGWTICEFTSFSTVLRSYRDDGRVIMKGCVQ